MSFKFFSNTRTSSKVVAAGFTLVGLGVLTTAIVLQVMYGEPKQTVEKATRTAMFILGGLLSIGGLASLCLASQDPAEQRSPLLPS